MKNAFKNGLLFGLGLFIAQVFISLVAGVVLLLWGLL